MSDEQPMSDLSDPLEARRLYIAHLAAQLDAMDSGAAPLRAVAYRLFARRLLAAMAGYPEAQLAAELGGLHGAVRHALEQRHFDVHGVMAGEGAAFVHLVATALLRKAGRRGRRR